MDYVNICEEVEEVIFVVGREIQQIQVNSWKKLNQKFVNNNFYWKNWR